jgi:ABC-type multidrug transport system ATPase subunit
MSTDLMIEAQGLRKRFGDTVALDGLDLAVPRGAVLGVLGPNGAGKTTAVRILTTLTLPDAGIARVAGHHTVAEAQAVRRSIGVAAQSATLDEVLTGRQNLVMVGRLSGLRRRAAHARALELLEQLELAHAAERMVKEYSGGMRRLWGVKTRVGIAGNSDLQAERDFWHPTGFLTVVNWSRHADTA